MQVFQLKLGNDLVKEIPQFRGFADHACPNLVVCKLGLNLRPGKMNPVDFRCLLRVITVSLRFAGAVENQRSGLHRLPSVRKQIMSGTTVNVEKLIIQSPVRPSAKVISGEKTLGTTTVYGDRNTEIFPSFVPLFRIEISCVINHTSSSQKAELSI